jgi:hypothetical protein
VKERIVEQDKQMSLRFEPSVLPSEATSSDRASQLSGLAIPDQSASVQRTALILQMPDASARGTQATQQRDSDLLGRILNRVKLF